MRNGLYSVEFHTIHGTGCGVVYAIDGKVRRGNSAFAFIGSYSGTDDDIVVKVSTQRHNQDPSFKPLFGVDRVTLTLKGSMVGDVIELEGDAMQLPGVNFRAMLTRLCD
ncbi:MAG: GrlR family regulatory protein [Xanthobacteraceae bacterium]